MKEVTDPIIDSPAHESFNNVEGCYSRRLFKSSSFSNSYRVLQSGADRISKTLRNVKNSFGSITKHFRLGSRRRHRLAETASPCHSPVTPNTKKQVLGRSPARLYSPFGIETPCNMQECRMSPYMPDTPDHGLSPKRSKAVQPWQVLAKKRPRALFR